MSAQALVSAKGAKSLDLFRLKVWMIGEKFLYLRREIIKRQQYGDNHNKLSSI
jgi:hypothetical protein